MSNELSHELRELRREAKRLVKAVLAGDAGAVNRVVKVHPRFPVPAATKSIQLADAQLVLARERGHATWTELKRDFERRSFVRSAREARVRELIDAICDRGWDVPSDANLERAREYLRADPELARDDFVLACVTGEVEVVRARLEKEPALATTEQGPRIWPPLVYVAFSTLAKLHDERATRITEVGKLLLLHGASPDSHYEARIEATGEPMKFSALFACVHASDNLDLARALLEAGAESNDGNTLYHAAQRSDTRALELLYGFGIDPDWLSYCLFHKLDFGHTAGVRWFLDHGADPNADPARMLALAPGGVPGKLGFRPLHWAIHRPGPRANCELLLERGANPNERTAAGHTALDLAERWHGRVDLVPALERHGATRSPRSALDELVVAAAYGDEARARAILAQQPDLLSNPRDENRTLVPAFAETGNIRGACVLIRLRFDAAATSWMGMTAVHWAACHGTPGWLRELLDAGAPLIDVPGVGTPLHTALYRQWFWEGPGANDYAGVVRVLLDAGISVPDDLKATGNAEIDALLDAARAAPGAESRRVGRR